MLVMHDDCQYCKYYGYCMANDWPGCRGFQGTSSLYDEWDN